MGDGVYEGQFLALWRFTGVAFKANYKYLRVNTDNQCLDDFEYETVYNPDLLIDVDEVTETINDIAEILETFFGSLDELTNQFYDDIQDGNRDPEDAINDFINTLKDSISNNPNIPEEEKETLLYYVSSDDYREVLVEAVKDPTNYEVFNNNVITPLRNPNTDGGYYLTINGKKALKLDKKRIEDRFNVTSKWRDEVSIGNLDAYLEANRIRLYVLNDPNVNDYKISIKNFKSNGQSQNAANLYFDNAKTEREKDINFSHSTRSLSDIIVLFYNRPNVNEDYTSAVYEIELVRVTPNIAYKQGNVTRGLILKEDVNTVSLLGDKVLLCPVFLTGEDGELKSENIDKVISERNSSCFHLVDTILFNYEKQDVEVAMGWKEYTLGNESSIYEIKFSNENNNRIKGIIEHEQSPFATVARSNSNKNTGYYIEDFYSSFISPTSTLLNGNVNNADGINFGNSSPYKMPIVHYKGNVTDIMLQLAAVNDNGSGIRIINESEKLEYNIGDKPVMLGGERSVPITVKPQDKNTVDITDMYSNTRGKIEFRQISGEELPPILNIVTINGDPDGINDYIGFLDSVLTNINGIYSAMNIKWQRGRHIPINVSGFDRTIGISGNEGMKDNIIEILGNYDSKQYYMIVVSNLSSENDINGFTEYNERNGTNWFFVRNDLNSANEDANTYAHELGHCNGLHEYAVDIGLVAANKREAIINSPAQRETTNVMGYGRNKPLKDFFSWQIEIIRRLMKNRIE
jgi:hypothetical protein